MEGANTGEVAFDGLGLQSSVSEGGDPLQDSGSGGGEILTRRGEKPGASADKVDVRAQAGCIGFLSAEWEAMEEIEGDA